MTATRMRIACALALAASIAVGCGGKETPSARPADGAMTGGSPDARPTTIRTDAGAPPERDGAPPPPPPPVGMPDGGAADGTTMSIPLFEWIHDLVTNYTSEGALPDTVEDKRVTDTDDPGAFDSLLGR